MGGTAARDRFMRLYMMPGVAHCEGGSGPDQVDWLTALENWVERGQAPEQVLARKIDAGGEPEFARPLAPYPARARYQGTGNWRSADTFQIDGGSSAP
jgi:feruloyl esterase